MSLRRLSSEDHNSWSLLPTGRRFVLERRLRSWRSVRGRRSLLLLRVCRSRKSCWPQSSGRFPTFTLRAVCSTTRNLCVITLPKTTKDGGRTLVNAFLVGLSPSFRSALPLPVPDTSPAVAAAAASHSASLTAFILGCHHQPVKVSVASCVVPLPELLLPSEGSTLAFLRNRPTPFLLTTSENTMCVSVVNKSP